MKYFDFRVKLFQAGTNMDPAAAGHLNIQEGDICIAFLLQKIVSAGVGSHFRQNLSHALKKFRYIFLQLIQYLRIIVTKKDPQTNTIPFLQNHYNYTINLKKLKARFVITGRTPSCCNRAVQQEGVLFRTRSGISPYTRCTHQRAPRRFLCAPRSSTSRR